LNQTSERVTVGWKEKLEHRSVEEEAYHTEAIVWKKKRGSRSVEEETQKL